MAEIYKITNPKNEVYIGQATYLERRINDYRNCYESKIGPKLYKSLKLYGWENHQFEIIEECDDKDLNVREKYWIKFYDSVKCGLNLQHGGKGGKPSIETREKISKSMVGQKRSLETRIKMSQSKQNHPMFNEKWRENMRKGPWSSKTNSKPILQFTIDGKFLREWDSSISACNELKLHKGPLSCALNGVYKTSGGYKWEFKI
jgi:group I intron endonuclease